MKGWGYLLALGLGALVGWIAQQFWFASGVTEPRVARANSAVLARNEVRLKNLFQLDTVVSAEKSDIAVQAVVPEVIELEQLMAGRQFEAALALHESDPQRYVLGQDNLKQLVEGLLARQLFAQAIELIYEQRLYLTFDQEEAFQLYINEVVGDIEARLQEGLRWTALVDLFRSLVSLHPDYVPYTLKLVYWLIETQQYDQAEVYLVSARNDFQFSNQVAQLQALIEERRQIQSGANTGIPLQRAGRHFLTEIDIGQGNVATLLVDTGASLSVVKASLASAMGLADMDSEPVTMQTANGVIEAFKVRLPKVGLGGLQLADVDMGVLPLADFKYDGLLGMNVLGRFQFYIDQENSVLYLR